MRLIILFCSLLTFSLSAQERVTFVKKVDKVDVLVGGKYFTSYFFPGESQLKKAVLFPILSAQGTTITRGFPISPRAGERVDHPHHVGMWLNYEDVNGYDYWNNSNNIVASLKSHKMGTIRHESIGSLSEGSSGTLQVTAAWIDEDGKGKRVIDESTTYVFSGSADLRIIDRITTLKAVSDVVSFKDVKDGMFAIRLARQLEIPSNKPDVFTDAHGVETKVPVMDNTGVTGNYHSSEGIEGEAVWSTRAKWMNLTGKMDNHAINVAILDHPGNVTYPSYWHARGYGLFAVNPLGLNVFTNGKASLNYTLIKGESITFRYRTIIADRDLSKTELDAAQAKFAREVK
ncbi:MAG: PmoA family protein [Bacteroidota bacterium]